MKTKAMNAGDEKQVKRARRDEAFFDKQKNEDYKAVLSTRSGRRLLWTLMGDMGAEKQPFTGNNTTFFNCGELNAAKRIKTGIVEADQEAFFQMMREAKEEEDF